MAVVVFAIASSCAALIVWRLDRHDIETDRARASDMAGDHAHALQAQIEHSLSATSALAALVRQGGGTIRDFESLAAQMLPYYPGASALQLAPGGVITQIFPMEGNEAAIGHDLLSDPNRNQEAFIARDSGQAHAGRPLPAHARRTGRRRPASGVPRRPGGQAGLLGIHHRPDALSGDPGARPPSASRRRGVPVRALAHASGYRGRQTIAVSPSGPPVDPVERDLNVPNATWTLSVAPAEGWGNPDKRGIMAAWGLLVSLLLAYHLKLSARAPGAPQGAGIAGRAAHRRTPGPRGRPEPRAVHREHRQLGVDRRQRDARLGGGLPDLRRSRGHACSRRRRSSSGCTRKTARPWPTPAGRPCAANPAPSSSASSATTGSAGCWASPTCRRARKEQPRRVVSTVQDITARKQSEADLRIAAAAFEAKEGMVVTDADGVILRINRACTEITGYSAEEAVGQTPRLFRSGRHDAAFFAAMWRSVDEKGSWQGEIWNRRKNGEVYPEWLGITTVKNDAGRVTNYIGTLADITQRKAAEAEIERLAYYDALTGLPNRRLLQDRLHRALASSARKRRQGALLFIDLDDFKTLNDTQGHDVGDVLLRQVAERLSGCVREGDTVARLGGDEYVVMLEDLGENRQEAANQTENIGEMVLARIGVPYGLASGSYHQTASIGIVLFGGQGDTVDDLLKGADLAMYRAKAAGGNTLRFFDPEMQGTVSARAELVSDLREGLREGQFRLAYQPQVDREGRLLGAEALLRWHSPRRGHVSPVEFIPVAEQTGLIVPIGQWVMEAACDQLVRWAAEPDSVGLVLAVNVSAREFRHAEFVERTLAVLDRSGADPRKLMLEFTESVLLDDFEGAIARMKALKARGVGFSLDDFGTGYSSLSYLKHLPVDQLKIDKSFVRDVLTDPNDAMIARAIVALAQSVGLSVVAEGVETEAQWNFLAQHGCHAFQGYYFGAPDVVEAMRRR